MKPPPFAYHRPETRAEVDALLERLGDEAKILAGGQSLIPILNMRLAEPAHLIDINHLRQEPLDPHSGAGVVGFGPVVRHEAAERSGLVRDAAPLVAEAMAHVAHPAVRSRGTVVGSIAHADPAAELPAVLSVLGGEVVARSSTGTRTIAARDFFVGPLENALGPDEWADEVCCPIAEAGDGYAFEEFARRSGDYALCGVAAHARRSDSSVVIALAYLGLGDISPRFELAPLREPESIDDAVAELVDEQLEVPADIHASREYRTHLARRLGAAAARRAFDAAMSDS